MNIKDSVKARMPGNWMYERRRATKSLKGTEFEYIYRAANRMYWLSSKLGKPYQVMLNGEDRLFRRSNYYDFKLIKLPVEAFSEPSVFYIEINDLIIPYLANNKSMVDEDVYEEYGVSVREGDIVIDAGANVGIFTAFAAAYRGAIVHAFEPVSSICDILKQTVELNEISDRVTANCLGLGNHTYETEISDVDTIGSATIVPDMPNYQSNKRELVQITTIDEYVEKNKLDRVDFIKADIEGSERDMLIGARETLRKFKPQLAICTYHLPDDVPVLTKIIKEANPEYNIVYGPKKLYAR